MAKVKRYLMKDKEGEKFWISADHWKWTGNGLMFFRGGREVAVFEGVSWQHLREASVRDFVWYHVGDSRFWFGLFIGALLLLPWSL